MPVPATAIPFMRRDARRGMLWLRRAYAMFRAAPLPWLLLLLVYYALVALAELGPWPSIGKLAASVLKPVFAVGFLAAAWSQERGGRPALSDLFRGFRSNLRALLPLGVVFFAGMTLAVGATALIDGGALIAWVSGAEEPSDELLQSGRLQLAMLFGTACALPTLLALWFAPALVVFHDAGVISALTTSLRASVANWRPTGIFGLVSPITSPTATSFTLTSPRRRKTFTPAEAWRIPMPAISRPPRENSPVRAHRCRGLRRR
ncbi:MAG: hypothetical protein E6H76_06690 [Betaproteobacteria bacterium]|nr:MAG: hypothetical protein E6H76_06690 [Betaproteobacteria bacterium]